MGGVGKGVGTLTVYPLYFGIFVLLQKIVLKCVFQSLDSGYKFLQSSWSKKYYLYVHEPKCLPSLWIHRKGHHKWLLIMSQILLLSSHQPKKMSRQGRKTRYITTLDKTCWCTSLQNTSVSQKYLCFPVILPKMETVAKWMLDFLPSLLLSNVV